MKRKQAIIKAATKLFTEIGFDATTTLQIAKESCVTEPLIYYHFKGKDELFTHILGEAFNTYFIRLRSLPNNTPTEFDKIVNLFEMHFQIVDDHPDLMRLIVNSCPAKLYDPESLCLKKYKKARQQLLKYFKQCLSRGSSKNEFRVVSIHGTANILVALTNGLLRQEIFKLDDTNSLKEATIEFCRNSLLANRDNRC
jgi:AcrR family transcriptional regulator